MNPSDAHVGAVVEPDDVLELRLQPIRPSEQETLLTDQEDSGSQDKKREPDTIVVTHDLPSAPTISDRLALMRDGQIVIEGAFKDLQASKDDFVVQFLNRSS